MLEFIGAYLTWAIVMACFFVVVVTCAAVIRLAEVVEGWCGRRRLPPSVRIGGEASPGTFYVHDEPRRLRRVK